jgi:hypothetical protein
VAIDDKPTVVILQQMKKDLDGDIDRDLRNATTAGVLALIPGVGAAIQSLLDGKARQNVERRWVQLFADLHERIEEIHDSIPDDTYYGSEEFQTLLALAYQQLLTTHDREKLKMLADALANSGSATFQEDDKEEYVHILRDLSVRDIQVLLLAEYMGSREFLMSGARGKLAEEDLCHLSRLIGLGLVVETSVPDPDGRITRRRFRTSHAGNRFLVFINIATKGDKSVR